MIKKDGISFAVHAICTKARAQNKQKAQSTDKCGECGAVGSNASGQHTRRWTQAGARKRKARTILCPLVLVAQALLLLGRGVGPEDGLLLVLTPAQVLGSDASAAQIHQVIAAQVVANLQQLKHIILQREADQRKKAHE